MRTISLLMLIATAASADVMGTVTLNTSPLIGNANGPFTLDLQFIDGDGTGDNNNHVTVSGLTATPLTLSDNVFFTEDQIPFTPGATLSFGIDATTNPDTVGPDTFTFAILDKNGNEIPTTNPNGFDTFFELDLPGPGTGVVMIASGTDTGRTDISIGPPVFVASVPEPAAVWLIPVVAAALAMRRRRA
jgi:hypothetical protein